MKRGWLVNDTLTCIPNTKTFWHNLLEWIPGLIDKTGGYTNFNNLAGKIETEARIHGNPDYIIRNGTFFRKINLPVKTVSLLQDCYTGNVQQIEVANASTVTVFNSPFTHSFYKDLVKSRIEVIPLGVDSDFFKKRERDYVNELGILPNSILFVGASTVHPKGFDLMMSIINNTTYNFCLVMKDNFSINHPRVKVFNRVSQDMIVKIHNSCKIILCTSKIETLHLAGIEGAMSGLPVIATNVGAYYNIENGEWGRKATNLQEFKNEIEFVFNNYDSFNPRNYFISQGYDINSCKTKWQNLINEL